ncbi:MAG: calcium/proton exchanger [Anaerolineae bacterium]|nr:calcium/proton exchanger [Anaerolineae bacterium]
MSINLLLVFLPIALIGRIAQWSDIVVFLTSALAIVPLAGLIGHATESLATKLGPTIGGLINVTLGNAAELIITIFALRAGLVDLVKASIVGSIIGNLLLVLGFSFLIGGLKNGIQQFNRRTASMNATMVIFAFLALAVPSAFDQALVNGAGGVNRELFFSEGIALVLIALYAASIVYSLRTPKAPFSELERGLESAANETHAAAMSTGAALGLLAFATIGIVLMSESLVGTVETVGRNLGLSEFFIGIIIVPLIGNVAEHLVAIQVALKNRMDLSVNISLGSSLQVALFVAPVLVFISLFFEKKLLLVFTSYELAALASASVVAALVSQDGESNWVEGVQLLAVYIIFGLAFYLLPAVAGAVH